MALYTKEQLKKERSIGLKLTDAENENYNADGTVNTEKDITYNWTNEDFENWLSTRKWDNETKNYHRSLFKGVITFDNLGGFEY